MNDLTRHYRRPVAGCKLLGGDTTARRLIDLWAHHVEEVCTLEARASDGLQRSAGGLPLRLLGKLSRGRARSTAQSKAAAVGRPPLRRCRLRVLLSQQPGIQAAICFCTLSSEASHPHYVARDKCWGLTYRGYLLQDTLFSNRMPGSTKLGSSRINALLDSCIPSFAWEWN